MQNPKGKKLIAGVGSALVDILLRETDQFLATTVAAKGGMKLVDKEVIEGVPSRSSSEVTTVPGGSACNTIVGVGKLGGPARFVGKRGSDLLGEMLETDLKQSNVEPVLSTSDSATGRVLSIITPDAQRSMLTFLGAASELRPDEVTPQCLEGAALVHIEGYLLFDESLMRAALAAAREAGARISLDLASYTVVEASQGFLEEIVREYVDILIANEDEARVFTGHRDEMKALEALAARSEIAALKVGKRGSFISTGGGVTRVGIVGSGDAIDTTGAGDLWASGFLYGLVNGCSMEKCGAIAAACGYEVCQVIGASIPDEGWARIRALR
jgi:sugar/nucleoside kinase (ribokinase family)